MKRNAQGFTIIELIVVIAIIGILSVVVLVRYNTYEARHAGRAAAQVLINDIKLQRQRAFTLEMPCGIKLAPAGNLRIYKLYEYPPGGGPYKITRTVSFSQSFRSDVTFAPGMADKTITFYPWTSGTGTGGTFAPNPNEWSLSKADYAGLTSISIYGGDMENVLLFSEGNALKIVETPLH